MPDAFICYSTLDGQFLTETIRACENSHIDLFNAPASMKLGSTEWKKQIDNGILASSLFIFLATPNSVVSEQVGREIQFAQKNFKQIAVLNRGCDKEKLPFGLSDLHVADVNDVPSLEKAIRPLGKENIERKKWGARLQGLGVGVVVGAKMGA